MPTNCFYIKYRAHPTHLVFQMWEAGSAGSRLVLELMSGSEGEARAKKSKIPSPGFSWETVLHLRSDLEIFS